MDTKTENKPAKFFSLNRRIAQLEFNKSIAGCYRDGHAEYDAVGVLLLTWNDDDMNCKETEVNALEQVFREQFNFKTEQYEIPSTEHKESFSNRLDAFTRCYDSPFKLCIIYYGGHAERVDSPGKSDLVLFARTSTKGPPRSNASNVTTSLEGLDLADSQPGSPIDQASTRHNSFPTVPHPNRNEISFADICRQLQRCETDILLIVGSCYAAGAFTDQPFGGRRCELFCSIAETELARAPSLQGSFTGILTSTLVKMIEKHPQGFSTADLYSRVYHEQHKARKPLLFNQSKLDFGKIWLRPCQQKATSSTNAADAADVADSKFTLDVRFHLTKSVTIMDLNKVAKALQWIPFVQKVDMRSMHSPEDDLYEVIRKIHAANLLRPHLIRIRRALDAKKQQQLRRTDTSPPSSPIENSTSERFLEQKPRDVELFNWSDTKVVTPHHGRLSPKDCLDLKVTPVKPDGSIVPRVIDAFLAQRALDGILFFTLGVVAPVVLRCAVRGCASAFAAS